MIRIILIILLIPFTATSQEWPCGWSLSGDTLRYSDCAGKTVQINKTGLFIAKADSNLLYRTKSYDDSVLATIITSLSTKQPTGAYLVAADIAGKLNSNGNGSGLTGLTAAQVGLTNVTNESKATMFTSPTITGNVILGTPASGNFSTGTFTWPTFNQNTSGSAGSVANTLSISAELISGGASSFNGSVARGIGIQPTSVTNAMLAGSIVESKLSIADNTTGNVSSAAHGFAPKGDGITTKYLNANGAYGTPTGVNSTITWLGGDVTNNNASANTIADVTALSFPVIANTTYRFKFFIVYTSAATTTGSRWSINGPATTFVNYTSRYTLTATSESVNPGAAAYDAPAGASASSLASGNIAIIQGIIRPSVNGTVIARFASEISGSAIVAKANQSYVEFQTIN